MGKRADSESRSAIERIMSEEPEVRGAYDLFLYNYGPDKNLASVHIELPDTMTVKEVDRLTRKLEQKVYDETGVILTGVGVYSYNASGEAVQLRSDVTKRVMAHDWALQIHGFYFDMESREVRFDVVMSFDIDHGEGVKILTEEMQESLPGLSFHRCSGYRCSGRELIWHSASGKTAGNETAGKSRRDDLMVQEPREIRPGTLSY